MNCFKCLGGIEVPAALAVEEIRLELDGFHIPLSREIAGRVYLDVNAPALLESIELVANRTFAITTVQGNVKLVTRF